MEPAIVEQLRAAARALEDGDTVPLVAMLDDDVQWRGVGGGHLWWKHTPE